MRKDFALLRKRMVQEQLIARGISDIKVLRAFEKVPRHIFVSKPYIDCAYGDFPLSIGAGQTISQPYIVALMTQALALSGKEIILEIGTGSGYQAAILGKLVSQVYSVERVAKLAEVAQKRLLDLAYQNIQIKIADGSLGWLQFAPYDKIIVTAGAPTIPQPLIEQLKIKGKLIIPLGGRFNQTLTIVTKHKDGLETENVCECIFVSLMGKYGWHKEGVDKNS